MKETDFINLLGKGFGGLARNARVSKAGDQYTHRQAQCSDIFMRIRPVRGYAANANFPLLRFASQPAPEWPNQRRQPDSAICIGFASHSAFGPAAAALLHFGKANSLMISTAYYVWPSATH